MITPTTPTLEQEGMIEADKAIWEIDRQRDHLPCQPNGVPSWTEVRASAQKVLANCFVAFATRQRERTTEATASSICSTHNSIRQLICLECLTEIRTRCKLTETTDA